VQVHAAGRMRRPPAGGAVPPDPMPCYVINLARERQRWLEMRERCERVGVAATRFEATAGDSSGAAGLAGAYDRALNAAQFHRPLTAGEIGCYLSHRRVWRALLASRARCCVVLEDDMELADDFAALLGQLAALDGDWDMIKLIGRDRESPCSRRRLGAGERELVRYRRVPSFTGAYAISRAGAEKLLRRRAFGRPIDVDLRHWWEAELRILGVLPYPARFGAASRFSSTQPHGRERAPRSRLHKLGLQLRYSWRNWIEGRRSR